MENKTDYEVGDVVTIKSGEQTGSKGRYHRGVKLGTVHMNNSMVNMGGQKHKILRKGSKKGEYYLEGVDGWVWTSAMFEEPSISLREKLI